MIKSGWTKGELARDRMDFPVPPERSDACKWCMEGALLKVSYEEDINLRYVDQAIEALYYSIGEYKDNQNDESSERIVAIHNDQCENSKEILEWIDDTCSFLG